MINNYTLTSTTIDGHIELRYEGGYLNKIEWTLKQPLNDRQFTVFLDTVPMLETEISQLEKLGLKVGTQLPTNLKLALFCRLYEVHKKIKYKVSAADSGKIKLIKVEESTLNHYFTSENFIFKGKHSVSNLVKYYNELLAEMAAPKHAKHPDHYSDVYMKKLDGKELSDYYQHLHSLGFKPVRNGRQVITDWVKE